MLWCLALLIRRNSLLLTDWLTYFLTYTLTDLHTNSIYKLILSNAECKCLIKIHSKNGWLSLWPGLRTIAMMSCFINQEKFTFTYWLTDLLAYLYTYWSTYNSIYKAMLLNAECKCVIKIHSENYSDFVKEYSLLWAL